jgi:hypothetical protein
MQSPIRCDNEESFVSASTPPTSSKHIPSSPIQQPISSLPSTEKINSNFSSPCLSVKFEQGDVKFHPQHIESPLSKKEHDQYSLTSQTSSTCNRGLDRMLLERNIEKLLEQTETSGFQSSLSHSNTSMADPSRSPQINRLMHQDRSREPLDLTDLGLSLDNLTPKCNISSTKESITDQPLMKDADITSSMPELHVVDGFRKVEDAKDKIKEALPTPRMFQQVIAEPSKPIGEFNISRLEAQA